MRLPWSWFGCRLRKSIFAAAHNHWSWVNAKDFASIFHLMASDMVSQVRDWVFVVR